jgi:hypothetical protein
MPRASPPLLRFTKINLRRVSVVIRRNLTPDLLPLKYRAKNAQNPMFGHCHTASGCLYKIFGSQSLHMYRALDEDGIWHWWVKDREGNVIDLTATQYSHRAVSKLYKHGHKSSMLGFSYRNRVEILLSRVREEL